MESIARGSRCSKIVAIVCCLNGTICNTSLAQSSVCYGASERGRIENAVKLPSFGKNFISYGSIPELAGRTYVHDVVRDVIVEAYKALEISEPLNVYKFAETGGVSGGQFKPHKTHQNGTSVDFIVPVKNSNGSSVHLPTNPENRYGYAIEFDERGRYDGYQIDWEALAAHIVALDKAAKANKVSIRRVIFDPKLLHYLHKTRNGEYIKQNVFIPTKNSWVRHDEHYHVDFSLRCKPL